MIAAVLHHMNDDHPADSLVIARAFADPDAETAAMTGLDENVGNWSYTIGGASREFTVAWPSTLSERREIRVAVVETYEAACRALGIPGREH